MKFYSNCLLSKWGFCDGDILDDLLWDNNISNNILWKLEYEHDILIEIIKTYVIPKLDQKVEVCTIGGIHNPIRASKVNGIDVEYMWLDSSFIDGSTITPEFIEVDDNIILQHAKKLHEQKSNSTNHSNSIE